MDPKQIETMLEKLLADKLAPILAKKAGKAKKAKEPLTEEQKAANRVRLEKEVATAFKTKGYKDVRPRENILTFGQWLLRGRVPNKGTGIRFGRFVMFHENDTRPARNEEVAAQETVH